MRSSDRKPGYSCCALLPVYSMRSVKPVASLKLKLSVNMTSRCGVVHERLALSEAQVQLHVLPCSDQDHHNRIVLWVPSNYRPVATEVSKHTVSTEVAWCRQWVQGMRGAFLGQRNCKDMLRNRLRSSAKLTANTII